MPFELRPAEISETVRFRDAGRDVAVKHVFRFPKLADWWAFEQALQKSTEVVTEQAAQAVKFDRREADAAEALWDALILRTEGYRLRDGSETPPASVPLLHKIAASRLLAQVFVDDPSAAEGDEPPPYVFDPVSVDVRLIAQRSGTIHEGLTHTLRRPTAAEQKEYSRKTSGALFVAGSRTQKSLIPARLKDLVAMYDRLVIAVVGYAIDGHPVTVDDAKEYMDALHKQAAIQELFAPVE